MGQIVIKIFAGSVPGRARKGALRLSAIYHRYRDGNERSIEELLRRNWNKCYVACCNEQIVARAYTEYVCIHGRIHTHSKLARFVLDPSREEQAMETVDRILCPTDFSKPSYEAIRVAGDLASQFSAELVLVHVLTPLNNLPPYSIANINWHSFIKRIKEQAERSIEQVAHAKVPENVHLRTKIVAGSAADEIVKTADTEHADIIVIATHGNTGLKHLLHGSVAEKVVRHASCPVLTVRIPHSEN